MASGRSQKRYISSNTCTIDCEGTQSTPHRAFHFLSGEGPEARVAGITVTGGAAYGP